MVPPLRHKEEDLLFKGKNIHCKNEPLYNKGRGDSLVYRGYFKRAEDLKEEIVVRKIKVTDCCEQWKEIFNKHTREDPIKHENVLKIISYEEMDEWRFFALKRYDATLEQFCRRTYLGPMPSDAQVLCQITKGLLYLHAEQCSHGNLTPRTILIASSQPVRMMIKLSEFGLSKFGDQCDEKLGKQHELCKKKYWILDYIIDYIAESYFFRNFPFFSRLVNNWKNSRQPLGDRQCDEETGKQQEFCLRKYWILNGTPTPNQDIFSAGCVSFYFLKRGVHPFGDDSSSILENIKQRNPVNLLKTEQQDEDIWEFAYDPIKNMIGDPPTDGTNWLMIAKDNFKKALPLRFEEKEENELGRGGYGKVYKGMFEGNAVAVKVHLDDAMKQEQKREMEEHLRLDHENVLKLLHIDDSRDKTCLVLELCARTLTDYCEKKYNGPELPPDGQVLYQIANGLHYIHSRNLVHRDVKPDNILISITTPVQMKLSDFGLVKKTSPQGTCTQRSQLNGLKGTPYWTIAPENLEFRDKVKKSKRNNTFLELPHGTIKSDIWAAGLVFFYFLTRGSHPYGRFEIILKDFEISANIEKNNPIELIKHIKNLQGDDLGLYELIGKMIKPKEERISLPEVIEQLTTKLNASRQFKKFERSMSGIDEFYCHFHPTEPVLACTGVNKVILLSADNSSIPFSNWKEKETKLELAHFEYTATMEWNADGTQLAAIAHTEGDFNAHSPHTDHNIIVWNYPSGKILFQKKLNEPMYQIKWNPFRPNVFATSGGKLGSKRVVFFFNSCPVDQRSFHFYTIESDHTSFQWISENRVALGSLGWGIEIWEIDESTAIANVVKRFQHEKGRIFDMAWDERTKCLAACSSNGWIKIWSMDSDQPIHALQMKDVQCRSLVWRPNGKQMDDEGVDAARKSAYNFILACGLFDGRIVIWTPLLEEKKQRIRSQHSHLVSSLSFSPDGRFLAAADTNWKLGIWATEDWEPVYIGKGEWGDHLSWLFSSMDVPNYKLTFNTCSDKVRVVEYAVGQAKQRSKNRPH